MQAKIRRCCQASETHHPSAAPSNPKAKLFNRCVRLTKSAASSSWPPLRCTAVSEQPPPQTAQSAPRAHGGRRPPTARAGPASSRPRVGTWPRGTSNYSGDENKQERVRRGEVRRWKCEREVREDCVESPAIYDLNLLTAPVLTPSASGQLDRLPSQRPSAEHGERDNHHRQVSSHIYPSTAALILFVLVRDGGNGLQAACLTAPLRRRISAN